MSCRKESVISENIRRTGDIHHAAEHHRPKQRSLICALAIALQASRQLLREDRVGGMADLICYDVSTGFLLKVYL